MGISEKKVLFVTAYKDENKNYDYWDQNVIRNLRYSYEKSESYSLHFLKKNIPQIKILQYPTYQRYIKELNKGYDIVGFSFYTFEVPKILKMVKTARSHGVKELWAGNYGVLTYGIEKYFDKIHVGYGERWVADQLDTSMDRIEHPVIIERVNLPLKVGVFPTGILFTSRGCVNDCSFCQTPEFCNGTFPLPLKSIEDVIKQYKKYGVEEILISDENFGIHGKHSKKVIELLHSHGMNWYPMTRIDLLDKKLDMWYEKGLAGTFLGIESLRQTDLDVVGKNFEVEQTERVLKGLEERDIFTVGYYIIGFEDDTEDVIKGSIHRFNEFSIDMLQVCILTPLPRTKLWDHIHENYGIFEKDWSKWDTKHLVWNHPRFTPKQLRELLKWCFREAYPHKRFIQTPRKYFKLHERRLGTGRTMKKIILDVFKANKNLKA